MTDMPEPGNEAKTCVLDCLRELTFSSTNGHTLLNDVASSEAPLLKKVPIMHNGNLSNHF
jgi:hypothetical protein